MRYLFPLLFILLGCSNSNLKEEPNKEVNSTDLEVVDVKDESDLPDSTNLTLASDSVNDNPITPDTLELTQTIEISNKSELEKEGSGSLETLKETKSVKEKVVVKKESEEELFADEEEDIAKTKEDIWNELLEAVNDDGKVDYNRLVTQKNELNEYLRLMDIEGPEPDEVFPLSYYINLYNASTIKQVVDRYPIRSMKEIPNAWENKVVKIKGQLYSLNQLENEIIRKQFKDPLIHFGLNCAANSCPKLLNKPYIGDAKEQLDQMTERFLKDSYIGVRIEGKKVYLSKIFEWYANDFGGRDNLLKWIGDQLQKELSDYELADFIHYDWSINKI